MDREVHQATGEFRSKIDFERRDGPQVKEIDNATQTLALKCLAAGVALGLSSAVSAVPTYIATYDGDACVSTCGDLASSGLTVSGGAVISPATTQSGVAKRPGDDTGNGANVLSYNVTSANDNPDGAISPITVSGLSGVFDLYWGSIDSYNIIEFFLGNDGGVTYTGSQAQAVAAGSDGTGPQFNTDGYFSFEGNFDSVKLSSSNGVAFEVARVVPEPGTLALLGLGLAGLGAARRRRSA